MAVRKNTRGRKIGRKAVSTKAAVKRAPRVKIDALDGAMNLAMAVASAIQESSRTMQRGLFTSSTFAAAVTGLLMQGETDPKEIARRADEIAKESFDLIVVKATDALTSKPAADEIGPSEPDTTIE